MGGGDGVGGKGERWKRQMREAMAMNTNLYKSREVLLPPCVCMRRSACQFHFFSEGKEQQGRVLLREAMGTLQLNSCTNGKLMHVALVAGGG